MKAAITVLGLLVVLGFGFFLYRSPTAPPEMTEAERAQRDAEVKEAISGTPQDIAQELSYEREHVREEEDVEIVMPHGAMGMSS